MANDLLTRPADDADAAGLIALIGAVYAEYPGCVLDVEREEPDLLEIASASARKGGAFWVTIDLESAALVGCVGWLPGAADPERRGWVELRKLYVARSHRRRGLASALCAKVEAVAREREAVGVELWSDTRFLDAHRFYSGRGYARQPGYRELFDLSQSREYHFLKSSLELKADEGAGG
jgi:putative acetyltransferase